MTFNLLYFINCQKPFSHMNSRTCPFTWHCQCQLPSFYWKYFIRFRWEVVPGQREQGAEIYTKHILQNLLHVTISLRLDFVILKVWLITNLTDSNVFGLIHFFCMMTAYVQGMSEETIYRSSIWLIPPNLQAVNKQCNTPTSQCSCHNTTTLQSTLLSQTLHTWLSTGYHMELKSGGKGDKLWRLAQTATQHLRHKLFASPGFTQRFELISHLKGDISSIISHPVTLFTPKYENAGMH